MAASIRSATLRASSRSAPFPRASIRAFSATHQRCAYDDTVHNLRIGKHTRVIYQGFTGRVATGNAKDSLAYGTNIVGGVTPGKEGEHLGLPLLPDLKRAKEQLKPDATAVFVAAPQCGNAIEQAIEAEIPLIVAVAEHIPLHDIMRVMSILKTQSKSRLVGANAPGIIAPIGSCRIGFQPLPTFKPGHVGIVAKSGTLSYETVASISRAGLGQSLCIGMGGDIIAGTSLVDALRVFEHDPETHAIVLVGEVGGSAEEEAADWIREYRQRVAQPKPIAALVGGLHAKPGHIMGHAGAWAARGERTATEKHQILQGAGATMVDHPENFGGVLKTLLSQAGAGVGGQSGSISNQKRAYHTSRRPPILMSPPRRISGTAPSKQAQHQQKRTLFVNPDLAAQPLEPYLSQVRGVQLSSEPAPKDGYYLGVIVDRSARSPSLITAPTANPSSISQRAKRFPYSWHTGPSETVLNHAIEHMLRGSAPAPAKSQASKLLASLAQMYTATEAITLTGSISIDPVAGHIRLHQPSLTLQFDDSALRSAQRQQPIHALRQPEREDPSAVAAEADGIVYVRLDDDDAAADRAADIGTLVNGAGLAMNTVDALRHHGGHAANFLDTGGKATAATVKRSFELILADPRVRVIFVNIFGGLTDGAMIADGILLAFQEVDMRGVPVVVRIRGTNEAAGQRIIAESGLGLESFDRFEDAARRVVAIARERAGEGKA